MDRAELGNVVSFPDFPPKLDDTLGLDLICKNSMLFSVYSRWAVE